jgi:predicted metal-dependent enzyme (double-stranded beta helix superfamily)
VRTDDLTGMDAPVRALFEHVAASLQTGTPDLGAIGDGLLELARDVDYLAPRIAQLGDTSGALLIHAPEHGPRLALVHRRKGQMGAVHDHGCWVALAPIVGVETHRHWRLGADGGPHAGRPELMEERALAPTDVVALINGDDIHDHGHMAGRGDPAYVLILTGDNQFRFRRTEWDLDSGLSRTLEPGDSGHWVVTNSASRV